MMAWRRLRGSGLVLLVGVLMGCNTTGGVGGEGGAPPETPASECERDAECQDGLYCNGEERCDAGRCQRGRPIRCDDSLDCTLDVCDEASDSCTSTAPDADQDGHLDALCRDAEGAPFGDDCDDSDAERFPGNLEVCDAASRDEDCDSTTLGFRDVDQDGFIDAACCNSNEDGELVCEDDCDDVKREVHPSATEVCDGLDNDCDGRTDDGVSVEVFLDRDFDGHGDMNAKPTERCADEVGFALVQNDCDDRDPEVFVGQFEICDGKDNNCDAEGLIDEIEEQAPWYVDADGDGFGSGQGTPVFSCYRLQGRVLSRNDCNDEDAAINPSRAEVCDGRDNDCNGRADLRVGVNDFEDDDGDGRPDAACGGTDCDDHDASTGQGATEVCDHVDNDCDEQVDEQATQDIWYIDRDGDGWGVVLGSALASCEPLEGRARNFGDCDDTALDVHPGTAELCDGVDNDCDGLVDEGASQLCDLDDALPVCDTGTCEVFTCQSGYSDQDGDASNGCEEVLDPLSLMTTEPCQRSADCDDGNLCNGFESCASGFCRLGTPIRCTAGPSVIDGDVTIASVQEARELADVERINGSLYVQGSTLAALAELRHLKFVGQDLVISGNPQLTSLAELAELEFVGRALIVEANPVLQSAELPSLASVRVIRVRNNAALTRFAGYDGLIDLQELTLEDNGLTSIAGLSKLESVGSGGVNIRRNQTTTLTALSALREVVGNVNLAFDELESLTLPKLETVTGALSIDAGNLLTPGELRRASAPLLRTTGSLLFGLEGEPLPPLEELDFPKLKTVAAELFLILPELGLSEVGFPALEEAGDIRLGTTAKSEVTEIRFERLRKVEELTVEFGGSSGEYGPEHQLRELSFPKLVEAGPVRLSLEGLRSLRSIRFDELARARSFSLDGVTFGASGLEELALGELQTLEESLSLRYPWKTSASLAGLDLNKLTVIGTSDDNQDQLPDNDGTLALCTGVEEGQAFVNAACDLESQLRGRGFSGASDTCGQCAEVVPELPCPDHNCGSLISVWQFGTSAADSAETITADNSGNVYTAGFTEGVLGSFGILGYDGFVRKYDASGAVVWTTQLGTTGTDAIADIDVDSDGTIYVAGYTSSSEQGDIDGTRDFFLARLDDTGQELWSLVMGTVEADGITDIEADGGGVVFAGFTEGSFNGATNQNPGWADAIVGRVTASATLEWTYQFGSSNHDRALGITIDEADYIYVAGETDGDLFTSSRGGSDAFLLKLDPPGTAIWQTQMGSASNDRGVALAVNQSNDIVLAGSAEVGFAEGSTSNSPVIFVERFEANGNLVDQLEVPGDRVGGIAQNNAGRIFVAGAISVPSRALDAYLVEVSPDFQLLRSRTLGSTTVDEATGVSVGANGVAFLSGYTYGSLDRPGAGTDAFFATAGDLGGDVLPTGTFSTVTALYDAIETGALGEGGRWELAWSADSRVPGGQTEGGVVIDGQPFPSVFSDGPLPLKLFEANDWEFTGATGTQGFDAEGYPRISIGSSLSGAQSSSMWLKSSRYNFQRFTLVRMRISQDLTGVAALSGVSLRAFTADRLTGLIGNQFVETGGTTQSIALDYYVNGTQMLTGGTGAGQAGRIFDGYWNLFVSNPTVANPSVSMRLENLANAQLAVDTATVSGQGDWSTGQSVIYTPGIGAYRADSNGTLTATALTLEVRPYVPSGGT